MLEQLLLQAREPAGSRELMKWTWMHRVVFSGEWLALIRLAEKADLVPVCPVAKKPLGRWTSSWGPILYTPMEVNHSCSIICNWFAPPGGWEAFYEDAEWKTNVFGLSSHCCNIPLPVLAAAKLELLMSFAPSTLPSSRNISFAGTVVAFEYIGRMIFVEVRYMKTKGPSVKVRIWPGENPENATNAVLQGIAGPLLGETLRFFGTISIGQDNRPTLDVRRLRHIHPEEKEEYDLRAWQEWSLPVTETSFFRRKLYRWCDEPCRCMQCMDMDYPADASISYKNEDYYMGVYRH